MTKQHKPDVNVRIDASTHRRLKLAAANYGITIKDLVAVLSVKRMQEAVKLLNR